MNPKSKEIISWSPDDKITIKSIEDFKNKLNISNLPEWELKDFFEKPLETTQAELDILRKKYLKWEPNLTTIKDFLESAKKSIIEEAKQWVNEVKEIAWDIQKSINIEKAKNIEWKKSAELAEEWMNLFLKKTDKVSWTIKEDLKDWVKKAKKVSEKIKKWWYSVQLWEALNDAFVKLKNFNIFWALISLFKWLFWMFVWNETLKKAWNKAKKVLDITTPEYKETLSQTQNTVIAYIEKATWEKFNEKTKDRLKTKLSPNVQGSLISTEAFEKLTKKIQSWKKLWIDDIKESWIILNIIKDPDFKEIKESLLQNINKKLFTFFKKKFEKSWVTFDYNSETKLKWIIKREFQNTTANKLIDRTRNNWWEVHFNWLEWIESVISIWTLIPNIILEAYKEDIIKAENLAIWIVESWKDTLSIWLKALDGQDIIPDLVWRMSWDDFDDKLLNIEPQKKILLERAFYAELWLVTSVLWTIWFYWTSSLVSIIEWGKNKISWKSFSTPPVERLKNTLNIISDWKWVWLTEIETALKDTQRSYEIVNKLKKWNLDELTKQKYIDELKKISWNFSETNTWLFSPKNLSKITKNLNPLQSFHFTRSIEQLQQITKTNEQLWIAIMKWTFTKEALKAKQFIESFKMRYINWRAILNITDWLKWKEFVKAMWTLSPEIVQWLFKVAPILIVWNTIWESTKEQEWEWYETLIILNWFMWWIHLFKETEINYTEEWLQIKNPESFAWWIALIWMETVFFWKDTLHYISKWQYLRAIPMAAFNSAVRLPLDAIKWIWWASVRWYESLKVAKSFLSKTPKKWKIWLWALLLLSWVLALEYASADEIDPKKLEKEWLIKNWEPNMDILKKKWPQFDIDKKEEIISLYSLSMLEKPFNGKWENFNFQLEDWMFNISIDKSLEKDEILIKNLLENVSRFLTEVNSDIKVNIKFN
jgi:hypothetical protein